MSFNHGTSKPKISKLPRYADHKKNLESSSSSPSSSSIQVGGSINDIHLYHQITQLNFGYFHSKWSYEGTTTLFLTYMLDEDEDHPTSSSSASASAVAVTEEEWINLPLHFRGGTNIQITHVQVATIQSSSLVKSTTDNDQPPQQQENQEPKLINVPMVHWDHVDPLAKVFTKPFQTFTPLDYSMQDQEVYESSSFSSNTQTQNHKRRYEADTQYIRGGQGMMDALRCKSIASNLGEVQITFILPKNKKSNMDKNKNSKNKKNQININKMMEDSIEWKNQIYTCWKKDLIHVGLGNMDTNNNNTSSNNNNNNMNDKQSTSSSFHQELKQKLNDRHSTRRETRLDFICQALTDGSIQKINDKDRKVDKKKKKKKTLALKVTLDFKMMFHPYPFSGCIHLGGIHFLSPPTTQLSSSSSSISTTPHIYTTVGTLGDHQGPRCWIPTVDSAKWNHRSSHEISIIVTAMKEDGLWPTGFGEDFGINNVVIHPVPPSLSSLDQTTTTTTTTTMDLQDTTTKSHEMNIVIYSSLLEILGQKQVSLILEALNSSLQDHNNDNNESHSHPRTTMMMMKPSLATAMWVSTLWNPTPARSLGFAIGPFRVIYDREYYTKVDENENNNEVDDEDDENGERKTIDKQKIFAAFKTSIKKGEGIRQLYFAHVEQRECIHKGRILLKMNDNTLKLVGPKHGSSSFLSEANLFGVLNSIERAIIASTDGVPMRALSLMRGILSVPRFRTSSYTQIWIPKAVDGGSSSGALCTHPEVACNPFIGGAIFDSSLLHPPNLRLPYYFGGRTCQYQQAQAAVRGWITAIVPLSGDDDVGQSYIHVLFECLVMSLYERAHGGFGEGGGAMSYFYCKRFAKKSGFNSPNIDNILPLHNIEDESFGVSGYHGSQGDDRMNENLWRSVANGTESHTSAIDEFSVRQLITKDILEGFERADKCLPSMNWLGSQLSATFLSSNSSSSSSLGCGAVELVHPSGGVVYRYFKCKSFRRIVEGRCGISNFIRVVRATIISTVLKDLGENKVDASHLNDKDKARWMQEDTNHTDFIPKQPFLSCVDEILKEGGISHNLFYRCLRIISGREPYLLGTVHDTSRENYENCSNLQNLEPEGFPNSYIRASAGLYLRVGAFVEPAAPSDIQIQSAVIKGTQLQVIAEPVIPNGGVAFGGPITLRVIENEGQCREFIRSIRFDGARSDWGPIFLHAKPVTTARQQKEASGLIESMNRKSDGEDTNVDLSSSQENMTGAVSASSNSAFDSNQLHIEGYQALELVRLTNRTPLLWIRIDPHGWYDGRLSLFIPDASLAEQLFHDGEGSSQVDALRALAERPLKIQGSMNISHVYNVSVSELPVRLLGDCLRGNVALHADLPHNSCIRAHAALAIAQWQNNKAPTSKNAIGLSEWIGLNLLLQYFNERFFRDGFIQPMKYTRTSIHGMGQVSNQSTDSNETTNTDEYAYIDSLVDDYSKSYELEVEEDEEYRVRSSCLKAIACCRAKDGDTPSQVIRFFERILLVNMPTSVKALSPEEEEIIKKRRDDESNISNNFSAHQHLIDCFEIPYSCAHLIAESLLALCFINAKCEVSEHPTTGEKIPSKSPHPCMGLIEASFRWLEWDLYREKRRFESSIDTTSGVGDFNFGNISTCAITSLCHLALLVQCTSDNSEDLCHTQNAPSDGLSASSSLLIDLTHVQFFAEIFKKNLLVSDKVSAAAATALLCTHCAADRFKQPGEESIGLLSALELLLQYLLDSRVSPGLRQTLATLMMDACTGKICSTQRVAVATLENDLSVSTSRFFCGPLGASYGGDNGSAIFLSVSDATAPAANAVNNGARNGLRLLSRAGQCNDMSERVVYRVAIFASQLWRTINGELGGMNNEDQYSAKFIPITGSIDGVCAHDSFLRASLLALWQLIWPKGCVAVMRVQSWMDHEGSQILKDFGLHTVMMMTDDEKEASAAGEETYSEIRKLVSSEVDRQQWRGRTASIAYELSKQNEDSTKDSTGLNQPMATIEKDGMWKLGGWVASTCAQRRAAGADGGTATKIRLIAKLTS